jgi:signal transduction histidine kinase
MGGGWFPFRLFDDERLHVRVAARGACAVVGAAAAFWITRWIAGPTGGAYFFAAFPFVMGVALAAGAAASLASVALFAALVSRESFFPLHALEIAQRHDLVRLVGFTVSATLVAIVSGALRAAYRRNARLRREAEEAAKELRRLQEARDDFIRALSHDVRTPLSTIATHAELLRRGAAAGDPEVVRRAVAIGTSASRIAAMVGDLVETFQLESGQIVLRRRAVDLAAFLGELTRRLEGTIPVERLQVAVSPRAPEVDADPDRLERILVNLVTNALKYSPAGTPVVVAAEPEGADVAIAVADRGPGIPPDEARQLFDRFFRGRGARAAEGLGLGLYITRLLVEAHGGRVSVDTSSRGTTFRVVLPAPRRGPRPEAPPASEGVAPAGTPR